MTTKRHPPKIIFRGDETAGKRLIRRGKQELFRTADLADRMGVAHYQRIVEVDDDGSYIVTQVSGELQSIRIVAAVPVTIPPVVEQQERIKRPPPLVSIYSGFAFTHQLAFDYPEGAPAYTRLHNFNPTEACRRAHRGDFDESLDYQPVTRLGIESNTEIRNGNGLGKQGAIESNRFNLDADKIAQTNLVHPCQYSGPMARIVSLGLGLGTMNKSSGDRLAVISDDADPDYVSVVSSKGFQLSYDFHPERTHGAMRADAGGWWLIEINQLHGIYARRLPLLQGVVMNTESIEKVHIAEFGGIPSGETFPSSQGDKDDMVTVHTAIELLSDDDFDSQFGDEQFFGDTNGWVFNEEGNEARIVSYSYTDSGWLKAKYWKLEFTISGGALATGAAVLTLIQESLIVRGAKSEYDEDPFITASGHSIFPLVPYLGAHAENQIFNIPDGFALYNNESKFAEVPNETDMPIWVGWVDGDWHTINFRTEKIVEYAMPSQFNSIPHEQYDFAGPVPWPNNSPGDLWYKHIHSYSSFLDVPESHKTLSHGRIQYVTSNDVVQANTVFRLSGNFYHLVEQREIHVTQVNIPQANNLVYFIVTPYNRNSYFAYHGYNIAAGSHQNLWTNYNVYGLEVFGVTPNDISAPDLGSPNCDFPVFSPPAGWTDGGIGGLTEAWGPSDGENEYMTVAFEGVDPGSPDTQYTVTHKYQFDPTGELGSLPIIASGDLYNMVPGNWSGFGVGEVVSVGALDGLVTTSSIKGRFGIQSAIFNHNDAEEWSRTYLVADGLTDSPFRDFGYTPTDAPFNLSPQNTLWWCQNSRLGRKASIYTNFSAFVYGPDESPPVAGYPLIYPVMVTEGIMPELPTEMPGDLDSPNIYRNWHYTYLTFVGINGV